MDALIFSINAVMPIFLLMLIGWLIKRWAIIDDIFIEKSTKLLFQIAIPCLLFSNIRESEFYQAFNIRLIIFVLVGLTLMTGILSLIVPRVLKNTAQSTTFIHCAFRSNVVIIGIPIISALVGQEGMALISIVIAFSVPVVNILAILVMAPAAGEKSGQSIWHEIYTNPLIIAALLGVTVSLSGLKLPMLITAPIESIADIATPFSLLVLGGSLSMHHDDKNIRRAVIAALIKTLLLPLIALLIAYLIGFNGAEMAVVMISFGGPTAVSAFAMIYQMGGDYSLAAKIIVFTNILSLFTMFGMIYIMRLTGIL